MVTTCFAPFSTVSVAMAGQREGRNNELDAAGTNRPANQERRRKADVAWIRPMPVCQYARQKELSCVSVLSVVSLLAFVVVLGPPGSSGGLLLLLLEIMNSSREGGRGKGCTQ